MDKTNINDILIEMIAPKVKEIEEKFGRGEGLEQNDISILLLKSQYNHINHLDLKITEVADSNANLRLDFADLKTDFADLKTDFSNLTTRIEQRIGGLEANFEALRTDFANLKTDIQESINSTMKWYIGGAGIILVLLKALDIFIV
jgi:predicted  nucleic acid-binding Zn-ribbon protein